MMIWRCRKKQEVVFFFLLFFVFEHFNLKCLSFDYLSFLHLKSLP